MSKERELGVLKGLEVEETTIKPREFFESNQTISHLQDSSFVISTQQNAYLENVEVWELKKTRT